jgi:DNA-binding beta-propeller fold protein YncE
VEPSSEGRCSGHADDRRAVVGFTLAASADVGPPSQLMPDGRQLEPAGRLTAVGNFPSGGALTPDGRFYWAIDSGHGHDDAQVVDVATGKVVQVLPLPGAYGGVAFSADGRSAYVSGEPQGTTQPTGPVKAPQGDAVHVFSVDTAAGTAVERDPIQLPPTSGGYAQVQWGGKLGWPDGLAVTPDGGRLVVALNQADQAAVVDIASGDGDG